MTVHKMLIGCSTPASLILFIMGITIWTIKERENSGENGPRSTFTESKLLAGDQC